MAGKRAPKAPDGGGRDRRSGVRRVLLDGSVRTAGAVGAVSVVAQLVHLAGVSDRLRVVVDGDDRGDRSHDVVSRQVHDAHTGGVATLAGDLPHRGADHDPTRVHDQDLVVVTGHQRSDHATTCRSDADAPHALPTAALRLEGGDRRALAEPCGGHDQQVGLGADDVAGDDLVAGPQLHPPHPRGRPAHGTDVVLVEADRLARARHHHDVVLVVGGDDPDELVVLAQQQGDDAGPQRRVVLGEARLLDLALAGGEEQVLVGLVVAGVDDGLDRLARPAAAAG